MPVLRAAFWRGGVCNALIFHKADLPKDRASWQPIFAAAMGSPDPYGRQLSGMGGGVSSLSKICIVSPSTRQDADVDFEFVQVVIKDGQLDLASNCGNMTAAIGPFSIDNGLVKKPIIETRSSLDPTSCTIRIFNTNTRKVIHSTFSISGHPLKFHPGGAYEMAGVAGTASRICLSFISPGGTQTDDTLPTGSSTTILNTRDEQGSRIQATLIDLANPGVHVDGRVLGLDSSTTPLGLDKLHHQMALLEKIRREGAEKMGLDPDIASVPKIVIVLPPTAEAASKGIHIQCLVLSMGQTHKAIPLTLALNLGAACKIEGTIPFMLANGVDAEKDVTIQHPSGTIKVGVELNGKEVESAVLYSTARLLMLGEVNIEA
jgi:2-methylaconitate cis-trans-isomerase PrpF